MTYIHEIPYRNSQMEALLSQMNEWLQQLEQENNEMHVQNLQYQHQIEECANEETPSSLRFRTNVRLMPLLETLIEKVTNDQITSVMRTSINNRAEQNQEEHVTLPMNTTQVYADFSQPNVISVLIPSSAHEA